MSMILLSYQYHVKLHDRYVHSSEHKKNESITKETKTLKGFIKRPFSAGRMKSNTWTWGDKEHPQGSLKLDLNFQPNKIVNQINMMWKLRKNMLLKKKKKKKSGILNLLASASFFPFEKKKKIVVEIHNET